MFFITNIKIKYFTRRTLKIFGIIILLIFIASIIVMIKYKPVYKVILADNEIGYIESKRKFNETIDDYLNTNSNNIVTKELEEFPEYQFKLVKRNIDTTEDEIISIVKENVIVYYRTYAVTINGYEKSYVQDLETGENIIEEIKKEYENPENLNIGIVEIIDKEEHNIDTKEDIINIINLSEELTVANSEQKQIAVKLSKINDITLSKPLTGIITSRYGNRKSGFHTGLDIATKTGTDIKAVADGTVLFSGWKGNYGNLVIISHKNGVETYYAHCSKIYVKEGQKIKSGQVISAVGSTGNSTGPHLHLEIKLNGETLNPQNYLYK